MDRRRSGRAGARAPQPDARLLPRVAVGARPRGPHDRRDQRSRGGRGAVPRAGLRPAVRRDVRTDVGAVRAARHARRHGRDVHLAPRGRPGARTRPAADRPHRRRGGGVADGAGLGGPRPRHVPATRCSRGPRRSPRPRRSRVGSRRWRCATAVMPTSSPHCTGRLWLSPSRSRPRTSKRGSGPRANAARRSSGGNEGAATATSTASRAGLDRDPRPAPSLACLPLASEGPNVPGASCADEPRGLRTAGSTLDGTPLWTVLWIGCGLRRGACGGVFTTRAETCGRHAR